MAFKKFWRRHPYLYSVVTTILVFAVVTLAVAFVQRAANGISGNQASSNPAPPVIPPAPVHLGTSLQSTTAPPNPTTIVANPATVAPQPSPSPIGEPTEDEPTDDAQPYSSGDCLAGNFESSTPTDVHKVSCSSRGAYEVLASYPGESETICEKVRGAELAYIQEELENGAVIWSYVQCLGRP
jgi:hypothetical protein